MLEAEEEWVVYRLKSGHLNAVPREKMEMYKRHTQPWNELVVEVVAEGLNETQARQFVSLTKESEE